MLFFGNVDKMDWFSFLVKLALCPFTVLGVGFALSFECILFDELGSIKLLITQIQSQAYSFSSARFACFFGHTKSKSL